MKVVIGCVDGHTYGSDWISDEDVLKEIDEANGQVGNGLLENEVFTLESMLELWNEIVYEGSMHGEKINNPMLTLTMGGRETKFKAEHIIWMNVIMDSDT